MAENIIVSSGDGYGGRPYRIGEVLKYRDGRIVTVVRATQRYIREDGMSFGVGDESGNVYTGYCRIATEAEEAEFIGREEAAKAARAEKAAKNTRRKAIRAQVQTRENYVESIPGEMAPCWGYGRLAGHDIVYATATHVAISWSSYDDTPAAWIVEDAALAADVMALAEPIRS